MKALSLFSGIGGLDIAAHTTGIETVGFCEIEPFAVKVLERRFPGVPIVDDVRKIRGCEWSVDVVHGGFPCQDLSVAGKQEGLEGARSGLWYEMLRVIAECRPRFVLAENVRGAINLALDTVYAGLVGEGYKVYPYVIPASAVGAPHQRERLFVIGVREDVADTYIKWQSQQEGAVRKVREWPSDCGRDSGKLMENPGCELRQGGEFGRADGIEIRNRDADKPERSGGALWPTPVKEDYRRRGPNSKQQGLPEIVHKFWPTPREFMYKDSAIDRNKGNIGEKVGGQLNPEWVEILMGFPIGWTDPDCDEPEPWPGWPAMMGERLCPTHTAGNHYSQGKPAPSEGNGHGKTLGGQCHQILDQYPWEPPRTCTGIKNRAARLKALGNAVVPAQAYPFFEAIAAMGNSLEGAGGKLDENGMEVEE